MARKSNKVYPPKKSSANLKNSKIGKIEPKDYVPPNQDLKLKKWKIGTSVIIMAALIIVFIIGCTLFTIWSRSDSQRSYANELQAIDVITKNSSSNPLMPYLSLCLREKINDNQKQSTNEIIDKAFSSLLSILTLIVGIIIGKKDKHN